ncbi:MAG: D-glycero-beta-D-manno-heptose 1-phosphate adenylyltransferase [Candidatus Zixiibacteriota bacterium]|nr:MAG: D-glycero-beta-D-manno-heptose 1-phosphate adenylyltransferase [candidate division Zixibacteria bacterium]
MKSKIVSQKKAVSVRAVLKKNKKIVVFTNGCFDVIHSGHAIYLDRARRKGDFLIVGLNTDKSVRRLKGKNRPVMSFRDRALLLAYLSPVDLVVGFGDDTPLNLIKKLRPDILVKGADYRISEIVGAAEVKSWGGQILRIPLVKGRSTSGIIRKLLQLRIE